MQGGKRRRGSGRQRRGKEGRAWEEKEEKGVEGTPYVPLNFP